MEPPRWPGTRRWSRGCRAWPPSTTSTAGVRRGSCGRSASTPSFPSPRVPPRSREYRRGSRSRSRQLRSRGGRGRCCTGSPTPGRARCRMTPTNGRTTSPARSGTRSPAAASGWSADASTPPSAWPTAPGAGRPPLPDHRGTAPQRLRAGQRRPAARGLLAAARRAGKPGRAALAADLAAAARRAAVPALRARHPVRGGRRAGAMSTVASAGAAATPAPAPDFELPAALLAAEPPEARGLSRGGVRLMVSRGRAWPVPAEFRELPGHLRPGDLVVVNTSSTLPAVLPARRPDGRAAVVRLATPLAMDGPWVVELPVAPDPDDHPWPSEAWVLPGQGHLHLLGPYRGSWRLWLVDVRVPPPLPTYLAEHGRPLRPEGVATDWPLEVYQSCFAREPGSTAMASAGRAFTTARLVNHTRASGGRVIAVGTTVVRALESVAAVNGVVRPARGWTEQVVTPERGVRVVDGLLTGWHEPGGSHLRLLEAVAGLEPLGLAYRAALEPGFAWGTFGDLHLILPGSRRRARR